jgi:S1-C subfamily serine protease
LLNVYGEVIGINTAIVASGQGIGFAIPVNMAKHVVEQLIKKGSVSRGWLGVTIQPVTDELAQSFGLNSARGALVSDIMAGSPAEKAGIKQGDVIVRFGGKEIKDSRQLQMVVGDTPAGQKVPMEIVRNGKPLTLTVTLSSSDSAAAVKPKSTAPQSGWFGLTVEDLPRNMQTRGLSGVIVAEIDPDGAAADAGIQQGDIILSVNRQKVANVADYARAMKEADQKGSVAILAKRGDTSIYFALKIR